MCRRLCQVLFFASSAAAAMAACVSSNPTSGNSCLTSGPNACEDGGFTFDAAGFDVSSFDTGVPDVDATADSGHPAADTGAPPEKDSATAVDANDSGTGSVDSALAQDSGTPPDDSGPLVDSAEPADSQPPADSGPYVPEAGPETLIVTGQASPGLVAVGGGFLYWATTTNTSLWREPSSTPLNDGGAATQITFAPASNVVSITADANNTYFATKLGEIFQIAHAATVATVLSSGQGTVGDMVTDGTYVYWTSWGDAGAIGRVPIGGPATADGGGAISGVIDHPHGIAVSNGDIYFTSAAGNDITDAVERLNPDGGAPIILRGGEFFPWHVVVDSAHIYWTDDDPQFNPASISRANLDGSGAVMWSNVAIHPFIALDAQFLYTLNSEGSFDIFDITTAKVYPDYPTSYTTGGLAMDGSKLYWTDPVNGRVWTAPKL